MPFLVQLCVFIQTVKSLYEETRRREDPHDVFYFGFMCRLGRWESVFESWVATSVAQWYFGHIIKFDLKHTEDAGEWTLMCINDSRIKDARRTLHRTLCQHCVGCEGATVLGHKLIWGMRQRFFNLVCRHVREAIGAPWWEEIRGPDPGRPDEAPAQLPYDDEHMRQQQAVRED